MNAPKTPGAGTLSKAILQSLQDRWKRFRKELRSLKKKLTADAVHDGRIACRRLLSTLAAIGPPIGRKHVRGLERDLKKLLGSLGPLRDVQVELETIRRFKSTFSRISSFRSHLLAEENKLGRRVALQTGKLRAKRIRKGVRDIGRRLHQMNGSLRAQSKGARGLLGELDEAFSAVRKKRRALDPTDVATLHRVRVALKKFRYMVEALQPILRSFDPTHLDRLRTLQGRMGDLHDLEVLSAAFRDFMRESRSKRFPHLLPLQKKLLERHNETAEQVIESADRILDYWQRWTERGVSRLRTEMIAPQARTKATKAREA
jgi:CHAD domain-containing protein